MSVSPQWVSRQELWVLTLSFFVEASLLNNMELLITYCFYWWFNAVNDRYSVIYTAILQSLVEKNGLINNYNTILLDAEMLFFYIHNLKSLQSCVLCCHCGHVIQAVDWFTLDIVTRTLSGRSCVHGATCFC